MIPRHKCQYGSKINMNLQLFTPFVPEMPYHILLYVVVHCTKGVVELTYK